MYAIRSYYEERLLERLLEDLAELPVERLNALRSNWGNHPADITVTTAYPLADAQRQRLDAGLQQLTGLALPVKYLQDSGLVAGIRITSYNVCYTKLLRSLKANINRPWRK